MALAPPAPTYLAFQHDASLHTHLTTLASIQSYASLPLEDQSLFSPFNTTLHPYILTTKSTIFHPQGGGQPSDTGTISFQVPNSPNLQFSVLSARMSVSEPNQVLHFGHFPSSTPPDPILNFPLGTPIEQTIDSQKRNLYSRLHTAGHVLGSAVRLLLENEIPGFDELKASHFPDNSRCEFLGSIDGKWKEGIQNKVDEYIERAMEVRIEWWDEGDFRREGLVRLMVGPRGEDDKWRVVRIVGAECYPCGGTHVQTTDLCGRTTVRSIKRGKGVSKVSYSVE